jgi:hypothetical protein
MVEASSPALAIETAPAAPFTQRIAETPPWTPWRLAVAIALALYALFFAVEFAFDRIPVLLGRAHPDWTEDALLNLRIALPMILLVAYLPAAFADGARRTRETVLEIAPRLRASPAEIDAILARSGRFDATSLRLAGVAGLGFSILVPFWIDRELAAWAFWRYPPEPIVQRALLLPLGWFAGRFIYSVAAGARELSRLGTRIEVDLLDLRGFAPLTRQGLRYALLVLGVLSILALFLFDYDKRGLFTVVLTAGALAVTAAAAALLLPLRGARHAIQAAKRTELDWCNAELRRARASDPEKLGDLAAWRSLVDAVPEWPLDAPTLRRFGLYLAIPLGSWLGGALVDQLVDNVLR